ncbi:hypothetical protein ACLKA6_008515 [Drosophila palustris]
MAALRTLAKDCNFGAALDRMLRDRFVCGMKDGNLQRTFLAEEALTLQRVLERALTSEAAAASAAVMRQGSEVEVSESIHGVSASRSRRYQRSRRNDERVCAGCGGHHMRKQCPHCESICHSCGLKGHLQRVCRRTHTSKDSAATSSSTNARTEASTSSNTRQAIIINNRSCIFEVDSGSPVTIMRESTYRYIWPKGKLDLSKCDLDLNDYQKNPIPVKGVADVSIFYNQRKIENLPLVIVTGGGANLLGCNWFDALEDEVTAPEEILMIELAATPVVNPELLASYTSKDSILSKILSWVLRGWPNTKIERADTLYPYYMRREELSANKGVLVWGIRAVIPPQARRTILTALHAAHPGIVKMKALARSYVWWPNIDVEIEAVVKSCCACQEIRNEPQKTPTHHWESTKRPW